VEWHQLWKSFLIFTLISFQYDLCKMVLDVNLRNVNWKNGKAEVDVTSLLLLKSVMFSHHLTRWTNHKCHYMINRGMNTIRGKWVHHTTCSWSVYISVLNLMLMMIRWATQDRMVLLFIFLTPIRLCLDELKSLQNLTKIWNCPI